MLGAQPRAAVGRRRSSTLMERTQRERTPEFIDRPGRPGVRARPVSRSGARLGCTTHIAVLDRDGWACSVTCSNGSASGVVVPGTGVHLNNMLGEQDLNPLGFHRHPPGRRMPSMMAPTIVLRDGQAELAVGSAGSNRIRSAILQTIIRSSTTACRPPTRSSAAGALGGRRRLHRAGYRHLGADRCASSGRSGSSTCSSAARRRPRGIRRRLLGRRRPATGRCRDRGAGGMRPAGGAAPGDGARRDGGGPARLGPRRWRWPALGGCGLNVQSPDLFLLTRTGQGTQLTLLVNDGGTISCNGAKAKNISNSHADHGARPVRQPVRRRRQAPNLPIARGSIFAFTDQARSRGRSASRTATPRASRSSPRPSCSPRRPRSRSAASAG